MADIDEDTLNVLLLNGVDFPTAYAASMRDDPAPPLCGEPLPTFRAAWIMLAIFWIVGLVLGAL